MLKILAWVIAIYIIWENVIPFIKVGYVKQSIKRTLDNLDKSQYKVLKKVKLPTYSMRKRTESSEIEFFAKRAETSTIDYLVISSAGVLAINILDLKHHFRGLKGNEHHEKWLVIHFSRIWLPFADLNSYREISNPLIKTKEDIAMLKHTLQVSNELPFYPVVVIVPKIKGVDLREREDNSWVTYPSSLDSVVKNMKPNIISQETVKKIYEQISFLQMQVNIGVSRFGTRQ